MYLSSKHVPHVARVQEFVQPFSEGRITAAIDGRRRNFSVVRCCLMARSVESQVIGQAMMDCR